MKDYFKQNFELKKANILVVDPSSNVCQILSSELKNLGFENIRTTSSVKGAMELFETEEIHWWITSIMPKDEVNAFHLLKFFVDIPSLKGIRTTLVVSNEEKQFLPSAFELGVLSYMEAPISQESAKKDLEKLMGYFKIYDYNDCLVASEYYRQCLKEAQENQRLLTLEEGLLEIYADCPRVLMHYGYAKLLNGDQTEAKSALYQAKLLDNSLSTQIDEILKEYKINPDELTSNINFLGINKSVIIDSDEAQANVTKNNLESIGIKDIQIFFDGQVAYEWLSTNPEPDLIIMEWKLPRLNAPVLIQRLRTLGFWSAPIIIQSALLDSSHQGFIREMGISAVIPKPIVKDYFLKELIKVIQQDKRPTEIRTMEAKIRQMLAMGKVADAENLLPTYLQNPKVSHGNKLQIQAEIAYAKGNYEHAKSLTIEALKFRGDSLFVLNLLGKILMKLGEFELALKCLEKAQALSPQNVERLCQIADAQLELGKEDAAEETLDQAKQIDKDNINVVETEAKHAMVKGETEKAKDMLRTLSSLTSIISYMNNRAIIYARNNQFQESIELYQKALDSLPEDKADEKAAITYNLALAYVREGSDEGFKNAIKYLDKVNQFIIPRLNKKAQSLKVRLERALKNNEPFKLHESQHIETQLNTMGGSKSEQPTASSKTDEQSNQTTVTQVSTSEEDIEKLIDKQIKQDQIVSSIKKGELCCYLITGNVHISPEVETLLKNPPKFNFREAIKRGLTLGADKVMASKYKN